MAGTPIKRQQLQVIRERGGFEAVLLRIAAGDTVKDIAKDYSIPYSSFRQLLISKRDPAFRQAYDDARKASADALVDKAQEIADTVNVNDMLSSGRVAKAKMQVELLKFRAGKLDQAMWGEKPASLNVNFDIGSLHLDALRSIPKIRPITALLPSETVDAEIEDSPDAA